MIKKSYQTRVRIENIYEINLNFLRIYEISISISFKLYELKIQSCVTVP